MPRHGGRPPDGRGCLEPRIPSDRRVIHLRRAAESGTANCDKDSHGGDGGGGGSTG